MIDKKVNLSLYTPQTLQLFKETHEQLISKEIGQLHYPLNWIKSITVNNSPVLRTGLKYEFTKTSLLYGLNGVGKSVLLEYIYSALTGKGKVHTFRIVSSGMIVETIGAVV